MVSLRGFFLRHRQVILAVVLMAVGAALSASGIVGPIYGDLPVRK